MSTAIFGLVLANFLNKSLYGVLQLISVPNKRMPFTSILISIQIILSYSNELKKYFKNSTIYFNKILRDHIKFKKLYF